MEKPIDKGQAIISAIIRKGGLMGKIADLYSNNPTFSEQFILECFDQCQFESMSGFWGEEIVLMITEYKNKNMIMKYGNI